MIFYYLTEAENVANYLTDGLRRSERRFYVFKTWSSIELMLEGIIFDSQMTQETFIEKYNILAFNIAEDVLEPGPIPKMRIPQTISEDGQELLQTQSYYAETDISPARIIGVKDAFGNNITHQYSAEEKNYNPVRRFLSYAKPYWYFIVFATSAGIVKFLIPLIFPYVLRIVIGKVLMNDAIDIAEKTTRIYRLIVIVLLINLFWMGVTYARSIFTAIAGHRMIRDLRVALVLGFGAHEIMQLRLTVGELTQFLLYLAMFYAPLQRCLI